MDFANPNHLVNPETDPRDQLLQSVTPVVVVPVFGHPLPRLEGSSHRFLIASNGVWMELARPWLHLVTKVGDIFAGRLPAGEISGEVSVLKPVPKELFRHFVRLASETPDVEIAAFITLNDAGHYQLKMAEVIENSGSHINYRCPTLSGGEEVVVDMHSHARHPAFFSKTDNIDDNEMVKFSLVVGNCNASTPTIELRLCALGQFINYQLPMDSFI